MEFDCSKTSLKRIGAKLRHALPLDDREEVLFAQYRAGHRNIIEAFRQKHKQIIALNEWRKKSIIFASRLKKRSTILAKLASRQSAMDLTRMNDIAGCRLIFPDMSTLNDYRQLFLSQGDRVGHYALRTDRNLYDYIAHPKETGYRGVHDVYEELGDDRIKAKIEVQYRTAVQHSWATALEIWDYSHERGAKFSHESKDVQDLFMYISELFWRYLNASPDDKRLDISSRVLYKRIIELDKRVGLINFFVNNKRIRVRPRFIKAARNSDGLIIRRPLINDGLDRAEPVKVVPRMWNSLMKELLYDERKNVLDSVLISMDSEFVRLAYNNYFDDAREFMQNLRMALESAYFDINAFKRHFVPRVEPLIDALLKGRE